MSFGRELKDFIAAFQAGEKIAGSGDDREYKRLRNQVLRAKADQLTDPENVQLDKDVKRARAKRLLRGPQARPMHPAQERALDARTDYYNMRRKQLEGQSGPTGPAADVPGGGFGPPPSQGAIPGPQSALEAGALDDGLDGELGSEGALPTQYAARGGVIKGYAAGGVVEATEDEELDPAEVEPDDDLDDVDVEPMDGGLVDDTADDDPGVIPSAPAAPGTPGTPRGAAPAPQAKASPGYSAQAAHDAALEGLKYAMKATGSMSEGAIDVSSQSRGGRRAYLSGAGASSPDEMAAVRKAIDPQGRMSESERNMAALAHVYEWNLKNNNPDGARRAAGSMMQYFRQVSDRFRAVAAAAAGNGDVDGALNAILKAHANIPDGKDMKIGKRADGSYAYSFIDEQSGKLIINGIATPEQILQFATKGAAGSMDELIARASGERAMLAGQGGRARQGRGPSVPKLQERDAAAAAVNEVADDPKRFKVDPDLATGVKYLAGQIITNNDMAAADALDVVGQLSTVGGEPTFKVKRGEDGSAVALMADGREVRLSKDAFGNLVALRGKAQVKFNAAAKKKAEEGASAAKRGELEAEQDRAGRERIRQMGGASVVTGAP